MPSVDGEDPCEVEEHIAWHLLIPYEGENSLSPKQHCDGAESGALPPMTFAQPPDFLGA